MPETIVLLGALVAAAALVIPPLLAREAVEVSDEAADAAAVAHRVALEALRDVEADRRAGSLDDEAYAVQLAEAESRAADTRAGLESVRATAVTPSEPASGRATRPALLAAAVVGAALLAGSLVPATGLANQTVVNEPLAAAQAAEADRQRRIAELLELVAANPRDADALSELADEYLAGETQDDLVRAAVALRLLIDVDPDRADAYERIITAYLRAGDYVNARAALDSYEGIDTASEVELAFFEGLIALRGDDDHPAARAAFDRFLELAPDDGRAAMVRDLRDEAESALDP